MSVQTFLCRRSSPLVPAKCQEQVLHIPWPRPLLKSQCQGSSPPNPLRPSDGQFGPGSCTLKGKFSCSATWARLREPPCLLSVQCPVLCHVPIFLLLYLYMCKLQMFVLSFSHEAVRSMFHTQMRWVGLWKHHSPPLPCTPHALCLMAKMQRPQGAPSVYSKFHFSPVLNFSSSPA